MKNVVTLLSMFIFFSGNANAEQVFIDFDSAPAGGIASGTELSDQYLEFGIFFEGYENGVLVNGPHAIDAYDGAGGSGNAFWNVPDPFFSAPDPSRQDLQRWTFSSPVDDLSFLHHGYTDVTLFEAFNSAGDLLEVLPASGDFDTIAFQSSGISRLDIFQSQDDFTYAIDNVSYTIQTIPEPASTALIAMVAGCVFSARRRMQSRGRSS